MHSLKKVITQTKSYDISFPKKTGSEKCPPAQDSHHEITSFGLGYRHLVAFLGFLLCSLVSMHRTALSVTIVAMVNLTESKMGHENSTASCPELSVIQENSTEVRRDGEFNWNSQLRGNILAISFFGYLFTNLFSGRIAEVWGAKKILVYGNLLTALCSVISPTAAWFHPYALLGVQFARGLSQGFTLCPLFVLMANWFPRRERGHLSTFVMGGFCVGALVGGLAAGGICDTPWLGWPASFYITGGFSAIVTIAFSCTFYDLPHNHPHISKEELNYITQGQENDMSKQRPPVPWKQIFTSVPVHALFIGLFGFYWSTTYFMSVHPTFMGTILQFSMTENGIISSLPFLIMLCGATAASFGSVWIMKRGVFTTDKTRKYCSSISAFGFSISLLGVILLRCDRVINILCFSLCLFFVGIGVSGTMIVSGDMSPIFSGSLAGIATTLSGLSSAIMPVLVGVLTKNETLQEWNHAFYMNIVVVLSTAFVFHAFGSADIQPWNSPQEENVPKKSKTDLSDNSKTDHSYTNEVSTEDLHTVNHM